MARNPIGKVPCQFIAHYVAIIRAFVDDERPYESLRGLFVHFISYRMN